MATVAVWSVEREIDVRVTSGRGRFLASLGVLAANFALLTLPPALGALVLLGVIR